MNEMRKLMEAIDDIDDEEDEWAEHFDLSNADVEKFKGRKIIVTDLYDGDVYGMLDSKNGPRFMTSAPLDRGYGVDFDEDEVEVSDLDFALSPEDIEFLKAWAASELDEGIEEAGRAPAKKATSSGTVAVPIFYVNDDYDVYDSGKTKAIPAAKAAKLIALLMDAVGHSEEGDAAINAAESLGLFVPEEDL